MSPDLSQNDVNNLTSRIVFLKILPHIGVMKNAILLTVLSFSSISFAANQKNQHKNVEVKSGSLTELQWKGSCEGLGQAGGGRKCDWEFKEDKSGRNQCVYFSDEYCVGATHYTTDLTFKYEPGKKKDTYLLTFGDGPIGSKLIKFVNDNGMLTETVLEETPRKSGKATKVKPNTVTYTGYKPN